MTIDIAHITRDLRLDERGIWRCRDSENVSYDAAAHNGVYAVEERSFRRRAGLFLMSAAATAL